MPALPRSDVFDPQGVGVYHCWSRCVRRAFLCGWDPFACKDCSHRKTWLLDGFKRLAGAMAVDVLDYAILDNHLHVVLRNRPDVAQSWSDEEVALRWWRLCPERKDPDGSPAEPTPLELKMLQSDPQRLADVRQRLSDISWFMRLLTQPVARKANREDGVTGRFFAERFGCEPIESLAQLLTCSIYVDLNLVRAGVALTPETSEYTSAYDRIAARLRRQQAAAVHPDSRAADADAWLSPIYLDERASTYRSPRQAAAANSLLAAEGGTPPARASDKGFLPMTLDQYLFLLDWTGRQLRGEGQGAIPPDLSPILDRLHIDADLWGASVEHYAPQMHRNAACCEPLGSGRRCATDDLACHGQPLAADRYSPVSHGAARAHPKRSSQLPRSP